MSLPLDIDEKILKRFDDLINEAPALIKQMKSDNERFHQSSRVAFIGFGEFNSQRVSAESFRTRAISLVGFLLGSIQRSREIIDDIKEQRADSHGVEHILGILIGLRDDYEKGMLADLSEIIEANVISDYMGQAEQLLGEGIIGQYDYVPAAVLAGAVLEDTLRRLCQRQSPPIDTHKPDGSPKTLDPLIADLQKVNVFNKAKADQLRSWAKTRNYAAHGEFGEFTRIDVEAMLVGVKVFIADHL